MVESGASSESLCKLLASISSESLPVSASITTSELPLDYTSLSDAVANKWKSGELPHVYVLSVANKWKSGELPHEH